MPSGSAQVAGCKAKERASYRARLLSCVGESVKLLGIIKQRECVGSGEHIPSISKGSEKYLNDPLPPSPPPGPQKRPTAEFELKSYKQLRRQVWNGSLPESSGVSVSVSMGAQMPGFHSQL